MTIGGQGGGNRAEIGFSEALITVGDFFLPFDTKPLWGRLTGF